MAIRTLRTAATAITEAGVLQLPTDLILQSGVVDNTASGLAVSAGSGLSVNISAGRLYLLAASGNAYPVIVDAAISNQAVSTNSSGNPRIDAVVIYADLGASANSDATNVAKVMIVAGTPAGSPSAPSPSTIQSAVGSGNPYTQLATVLVPSGASVPSTITDTRTNAIWRKGVLYSNEIGINSYTSPNDTSTHIMGSGGNQAYMTLPILAGTFTVLMWFNAYLSLGAGNNAIRGRVGTNSDGVSNAFLIDYYAGGAFTGSNDSAFAQSIQQVNLSSQQYASLTVSNDAGNGITVSGSSGTARTAFGLMILN